MSIPKLPGLIYGPPAQLDYSQPEYVTACVWGGTTWDTFHHCTVRGVPVALYGEQIVSDANRCYRKCQFPDGSCAVVNEGNIRITKVRSNGHPFK